MSAQWNLWYKDAALPPFSDPKYIRLAFRGKNRLSQQRIPDHLIILGVTSNSRGRNSHASEGFEVQCLAHPRPAFLDHGMRPEHHAHMLEGLRKAGWQE
jgi:hypothetical protein